MAKAKRKAITAVAEPMNDEALIKTLLQYGQTIGGALTVGKLEPGGNCDRSESMMSLAFDKAHRHIVEATALPAQTMEGLSAKARAVPYIVMDDEGGTFSSIHIDFLISLASDAKRLAEQAIHDQVAKGGAA